MKHVALPFEWSRRQAMGAVRAGVPLEHLLEKATIRPRHGDARDVVTPLQHSLLCLVTTQVLEDAAHGMARSTVGSSYPPIGLRVALGCANLEGAIQALARLYASASNAVGIRLRTEQDVAILSVHMDARFEGEIAYLEENYLVWTFMQCLHFLGRPLPVSTVTLRDPAHFSLGMAHWGTGGVVRFGDVTAFRFPRHLLASPPGSRAGENIIWEAHQPWMAMMRGGALRPAPAGYVGAGGFVRFSDVVRDSGRSANTLRRELKAFDGGFRDARRRALVEAASDRLCATDDSVEAIAVELGYSDARSFRRFVKTATGLTPQQIRREPGVGYGEEDRRAIGVLQALTACMNV